MSDPYDWCTQDEVAYETAANRLEDNGYIREPCRWYQYRFVKGREVIVLVRDLGELNWHPKVLEQ